MTSLVNYFEILGKQTLLILNKLFPKKKGDVSQPFYESSINLMSDLTRILQEKKITE